MTYTWTEPPEDHWELEKQAARMRIANDEAEGKAKEYCDRMTIDLFTQLLAQYRGE